MIVYKEFKVVAGEHYHLTAAEHTALGTPAVHNNLTGLQGGIATEYYHLKNSEYTALTGSIQGTWTPVFTNLTVVGSSCCRSSSSCTCTCNSYSIKNCST